MSGKKFKIACRQAASVSVLLLQTIIAAMGDRLSSVAKLVSVIMSHCVIYCEIDYWRLDEAYKHTDK